jgi:hypothetical protein
MSNVVTISRGSSTVSDPGTVEPQLQFVTNPSDTHGSGAAPSSYRAAFGFFPVAARLEQQP